MSSFRRTAPFFDGRCAFVGDSFVAGVGDREGLGWVGRLVRPALRAGLPLTVYNLGVRGETSADIAARWSDETACRFQHGDWFATLFSFGVNDVAVVDGRRRLPVKESLANAAWLVDQARRQGPVLFVGPPPVADEGLNRAIGELSLALAEVAVASGTPFLDVFGSLSRDAIWMREAAGGDGAHPGAAGYERLAGLAAAWDAWWFRESA